MRILPLLMATFCGCTHTTVVSAVGDRIAVTARGKGPLVVAVTAGPAPHAPAYDRAWQPLTDRARLVLWDYAGTGASPSPTLPTMHDDVEDLDAVIAAQHAPAILLAHSYGAMVALRYAAAHPERVRALILAGARRSSADVPAAAAIKRDRLGADAARWEALSRHCLADGCTRAEAKEQRLLDVRADLHDRALAGSIAASLAGDGSASHARQYDLTHFDAAPLSIAAPVFILEGADDALLPSARALADQLHAKVTLFAASGHYPMFEEPARFTATVAALVDEIARTTTDAQASPKAPVTKPAVP